MLFAAIALLSAAAAAAAAPALLAARQTAPGPQCAGLGLAVFDIAYNFTLAAYNATGPNANDTGAPLVLGQAGAVDGAEFKVLSTWASFPYNDFPTLSLVHGGLWGNDAAGAERAQGGAPAAGSEPSFVVPPQSATADPVYCGVVRPPLPCLWRVC
ncbi:hypothetical protein PHLGIDRAFT_79089 [Phlebiopsis gigantea 11061_1 CR5-6]|uniref:Uncharacterized protein n=1 Tax=Phlebiopsis gigantea (strain 11061_1 CR5-6) TaxID=745531 RepID=A0A0C3ND61_PHLG1|nr:hypothetical protein PHLGIDRAFT_79089 [Phlebiopsis gigantea 11061_1 CR5-6]